MSIKTFKKLIRVYELKIASQRTELLEVRKTILENEEHKLNIKKELNEANNLERNHDIINLIHGYIKKKESDTIKCDAKNKTLQITEQNIINTLNDTLAYKKKIELYIKKIEEKQKKSRLQAINRNK